VNDSALPRTLPDASARVLVTNPVGLHARPAVKLTKLAKQFGAEIRLRAEGQADWVNAKSPNAVMKLKLRGGDTLCLEASGSDANDAVGALVAFIERNFDE
jgi:phosphocarrier protein